MTDERRDPGAEETGPETSAWAGLGLAWKQDPVPPPAPVDVAAVRRRAGRFAWRIRLRNGAEWAACVLVVVVAANLAVRAPAWWMRVPMVALIAVVVWVGVTIYRRGRSLPPPSPGATMAEYLGYERAQLARQHALLSNVRRWYIGPIFGVVVLFYAIVLGAVLYLKHPPDVKVLAHLGLSFAGQVAFFAGIDFANRRAAKRLSKMIEALGEVPPPGS